ncbi:MAG: hypothetical protein KDC92_11030, partial [Bacteroidetes bacterium]|nr:hypothetical protein [Bacteroidota bacterium]
MRKVLLICLLLSTITSWSQTPWYELANNANATINEIEAAYNQQVKGLSEEKKAAYAKHFERWYAAIAPYILPDGHIQNRAELYNRNALITSHKQSPNGNWKEIGPFTARDIYRGVGRINCIAFHPTDSNIMYCGAALGGVWKTTNHGKTWEPLTDHIPNFFVTAIAVNPGNPDIIYAGTGDGNTETRYPGIGVWKSDDGGINWEQKSDLIGDQIVNDIIVHPDDNDRVIAAAHTGLYLSESGGNKWVRLNTGRFRELRIAPDNNDIIYASTNSTLLVSTDGGFRFTGKRLPRTPNPRLSIAVSAAEPTAIWLVSEQLVLKSDNYGDDIYEVLIGDGDRDLGGQSWYNTTAEGSPHKPGVLYQGHVPVYKTGNNGKTWKRLTNVHSDVHYMRHSPVTGRL